MQGPIHNLSQRQKNLHNLYRHGKAAGIFPDDKQFVSGLKLYAATGATEIFDSLMRMCHTSSLVPAQIESLGFERPYTQDEVAGSIPIGKVIDTDFFYHLESIHTLSRMCGVYGQPGVGKTYLIKLIAKQVMKAGIPTIIIDPKGKDYPEFIKPEYNAIYIKVDDDLLWNIFKPPPNVPLDKYIPCLAESISEAVRVLDASWGYLAKLITETFEKYLPQGIFPCFKEVFDEINNRSYKSYKIQQYHDTVKSRLESINQTLSNVLNCRVGMVEDIVVNNKSAIFDISGMSTFPANLIAVVLVVYIYTYHLHNCEKGIGLQRFVSIDEGQQYVLNKSKENSQQQGASMIERVLSMGRDYGCGILGSVQRFGAVFEELTSDAATQIVFRSASGSERLHAQRALSLTNYQADAIGHLQVGQAIVRFTKFTHPCLVQLFDPKLEPPLEEDWKRNQQILNRLKKSSQPVKIEKINLNDFVTPIKHDLTENEEKLCVALGNYPTALASELYKLAKLAPQTGNKAKNGTVQKGYVVEVEIKGGGSGQKKFFKLTPHGKALYRQVRDKDPKQIHTTKLASDAHDIIINRAAEFHQLQGAKTLIGYQADTQEIDLFVISPNQEKYAYEMTMPRSHNNLDIKLRLLQAVDYLVYLCVNKKEMEVVKANVSKCDGYDKKRVFFEVINPYVKRR